MAKVPDPLLLEVKVHLKHVKRERAKMADSIIDLLLENAHLRAQNRVLRRTLGLEEDGPWPVHDGVTDGAGSSAGS